MELMVKGRKICVNDEDADFHIHSNLSDGLNSIDEIVNYAGKIGLKKIAITDHSDCWRIAHAYDRRSKTPKRTFYERWKNIHNSVEVLKGIEMDLFDPDSQILCEPVLDDYEFIILSAHPHVYKGSPEQITEAYLKAIDEYSDEIDVIGHLCANYFASYLDVEKVVRRANDAGIAQEINCSNLDKEITDIEKLREMISLADVIYVNSDAHTLNELHLRRLGYDFLKNA
jgi:DNA polymerase (family 10)